MTDEPKDEPTSAVKPQVIDLEAEEVKVEPNEGQELDADAGVEADADDADNAALTQSSEEETPQVSPPPRATHKARGSMMWIAVALVLGLLAGGWFYRSILASYLPSNEMVTMASRIDGLEAQDKTLGEQLQAVSQSGESATQAVSGLENSVNSAATGLSDLKSRVEAYDARIAAAEESLAAARSDLDSLRNAVSSAGTGGGSVDNAALAAIGQRIDGLEKDVTSLKSGSGGSDTANATAALSQSLADLKAKVAAGVGFQSEYDRLARMVPAAPGLDILATHAANGIPAPEGLASELAALIPTLPKPETPAPASSESYLDSIWNGLSGIITIRNIGEADWPALAEKCVGLAQGSDLTQAIAVIDQAEGAKPGGISQWRDRAAARLQLEAALGQVAEAVLRQIAALGGAQ